MTHDATRRDFMKLAGIGAGAAILPGSLIAAPAAQASPARPVPYRVGRWLPSDQAVLDRWVADLAARVDANPQPFHPVIQEFQDLIESVPEIYMWFHQMFEELPHTAKFTRTPVGAPQLRDYHQLLSLCNAVLTMAPAFNKTGFVGFPINAVLDWPMHTEGGFAAFLDPRVNAMFKKVLNVWAQFLSSPASCYVLNDDPKHGWFGSAAKQAMPHFDRTFVCDPTKPYHGFTSWDDFFTRQFRPGQRPVASPNDNGIIANACESAPYNLVHDVKAVDRFWIKGQPYSLRHMFADDPVNEQFVGGTIYQAFLSALSYHRWHSPVSGTVTKTYGIDGSYYSETPAAGWDPFAPNDSQGYISEVATRSVMLIEADDPRIGLMAVIAVGMAEVSTCEVTVQPGQHINKGDELGMFHFGGSTHCLVFRPGVRLKFNLHGQQPGLESSNIPINAVLAHVV
jgi:phosphatidylserine decarboxylase